MKFLIVKLIFFFSLIGTSFCNENIRFININFIINNSDAGKNLNEILDSKNKKISSELNKIGKKLEEKKNKIVSQKNILKKEEFDNLVKNYDKELKDFNALRKSKTEQFNTFRVNSKKKIIDLLNPLITSYLKKESIQILLQKDKIIFGDDKLDITEVILKIFNDKHKKINFE
jgi:outer membrane protein